MPGQVLNPLGANAIPKEVRDARKLNKYELAMTISKYLYMPVEDVLKIAFYDPQSDEHDPDDFDDKPKAIDVIVCALIKKAGQGDYLAFSLLLERSVGRVPLKDGDLDADDPMLEHIKKIAKSPAATRKELDQLIKNRELIEKENKK